MPTTRTTPARSDGPTPVTPITILADLRRERAAQPSRQLADALVKAYRARGAHPPETLLDARRTCHSRRHRPLCPKLQREIERALTSGVPVTTINAVLREFVEAVAPAPQGRAA